METPTAAYTRLFNAFSEILAVAGGRAMEARSLADVAALALEGGDTAWVSSTALERFSGLGDALAGAGVSANVPDDPAAVRDAPLGITAARLAIAETGSVLLDEPDLANRAVSLMTQRLIVLCPAAGLVPSLDDAAPVLREISRTAPSYATFVTGPSRTADIERELAIGVQGPGELYVVFVPES